MKRCNEWDLIQESDRKIVEKHLQNIPIRLGALASDLGLKVKVGTLEPGISGEIRPDVENGSYLIRISRHEPKARQRFTLAHEISHYLLHRDEIGDGIEDSILYRSQLSSKIEAQANRLSADIIMPVNVISSKIAGREGAISDQDVFDLSEEFSVSKRAMEIRLGIE